MGLEETTALVALVISLIALVIATLQFLQALFGTAEGYKRCSKQVVGDWEGLRYRHFRPSEFRYEVQYITPQILLVSADAKSYLERQYNNIKPLDYGEDHVCILHEDIIRSKLDRCRQRLADRKAATSWWSWWNRKTHRWDYSNKIDILHSSASREKSKGVILPGLPPVERGGSTFVPPKKHKSTAMHLHAMNTSQPGATYEMRVTWDTFMKEICSVYTDYGNHPSLSMDVANTKSQDGTTYHGAYPYIIGMMRSNRRIGGYIDHNYARTDAAITFRQWSWDMMPSDTIRPLATIAIGHLVVLAVRLGMQWRVLNIETGMSADGQGYSLTGIRHEKLGFVFKLVATTSQYQHHRLIPNIALDKLICGILPGCPMVVKRDYDFIDNDRKSLLDLTRALEPNHVLTVIGVPRGTRERLRNLTVDHWAFPSIHNEVVPLLCTFLPLVDSDCVRHYAHCWRENRRSVFHLWEGRYALLHYLGQTPETQSADLADENMKMAHDYFKDLKDRFPEDFYGLKTNKAIEKKGKGNETGDQRRKALVDLCRKIRRWIDVAFGTLGLTEEDEQGRTQYENLVAAHLSMATDATLEVYKTMGSDTDLPSCQLDDPQVPKRYDKLLQEVRNLPADVRPSWVVCRVLENVKMYVRYMQSGAHEVAGYLRARGSKKSAKELECAWWLLMLRGITWDMSTLDHCWGEPIPASFYDNHVPVWIT